MGRPLGGSNYTGRLRAYEMYASGMAKASIAREIGVTKAAVGQWCKKDLWDERLNRTVQNANEAVDHTLGNEVAAVLTVLRKRMASRISELEALCHSKDDSTKLQAIKTWFVLAGIKQAIPNPIEPKGGPNLRLIGDLIDEPLKPASE